MNKQVLLESLKKEIENCRECRKDSIGLMVFGEGSPDAKIIFVDEAPGKQEAESGRPFIGRSGQLLRKLIRESGLKEDEVYITSPVKYLPERGTPSRSQINHARKYFVKQIDIINPELIVLLGKTAITATIDEDLPMSELHGKIIEKNNRKYFITYHPAAAIRFQKFKLPLQNDFKILKQLLATP